ncbi:hypothetical protein FKP32DRAFT_289011 [Trametes sanguinea]|nr:hypothetical protein FKP32DRAFT_289011 [Trametes sanguinea]
MMLWACWSARGLFGLYITVYSILAIGFVSHSISWSVLWEQATSKWRLGPPVTHLISRNLSLRYCPRQAHRRNASQCCSHCFICLRSSVLMGTSASCRPTPIPLSSY